jgi:three-Cys-motif partner protein
MTPYLAKVAKLNKQILLIDGYAGPGVFDDHTLGSPLIMCAAAEKMVKGRYTALFMNHDAEHHKKLDEVLTQQGWRSRAIPILGDSKIFLKELSDRLRDQTIFLYLDPYGLKGCEFATLEPFLKRDERYSTEIVINISMPITHRLAARHATAEGRASERVSRYHQRLTQVFGGEYWKDIMWSTNLEAEEKEFTLIREYRRLLSGYFVSRHPDAMLLMNDAMCKAYSQQMHEAAFANTLFASTDWKTMRDSTQLDTIILEEVKRNPGATRAELWLTIVQSHFMKFTEPEYKKSVERLVL